MAALGVSCGTRSLSSRHASVTQRVASQPRCCVSSRSVKTSAALKALLWDCDGVILESEDLHRRAYNAVFSHFKVEVAGKTVVWSEEYYDLLSNTGAPAAGSTARIVPRLPRHLRCSGRRQAEDALALHQGGVAGAQHRAPGRLRHGRGQGQAD